MRVTNFFVSPKRCNVAVDHLHTCFSGPTMHDAVITQLYCQKQQMYLRSVRVVSESVRLNLMQIFEGLAEE